MPCPKRSEGCAHTLEHFRTVPSELSGDSYYYRCDADGTQVVVIYDKKRAA